MCLAIPGQIVDLSESSGLAMGTVDLGGLRRVVCLAYVPQAAQGDFVVVHAGFAISIIDAAEAERSLALLDELGREEEQ